MTQNTVKHGGKQIVSPVDIEERQNLDIRPGDTVRVHQKISEGDKTRIQIFEGIVLAAKHGKEAGARFTVRRTSSGIGIEKIFPLYSPNIDKIEIVKRVKVRRSKLYYIRDKAAREIRRQMRRLINIGTREEARGGVEEKVDENITTAETAESTSQTEGEEVKKSKKVIKENDPTEDVETSGDETKIVEEPEVPEDVKQSDGPGHQEEKSAKENEQDTKHTEQGKKGAE